MKSMFKKIAIGGLLGLALIGAANANWQCRVHSLKGGVWYGTSSTRAAASAYAMKYCVSHSSYAANCQVDYCRSGNYKTGTDHVGGTWQCNASNARGQRWYGTGSTRAVAAANASGFCTAHSARASNCTISGCFVKY